MINTQIPKIENRQQNVSRIAGEIWNKLDDEVKQAWHAKAEEVQRQHKLKYPDYKFTPSRRPALKAKDEADAEGRNLEDYIRHLREKYMGVMGPAVAPTRKRKPKSQRVKDEDEDYIPTLKHIRARLATFDALPSTSRAPPSASVNATMRNMAPTTSLPPWRAPPQSYMPMPAPSAFDYLLMADEYAKMNASQYLPLPLPHETPVFDSNNARRGHAPQYNADKVRKLS